MCCVNILTVLWLWLLQGIVTTPVTHQDLGLETIPKPEIKIGRSETEGETLVEKAISPSIFHTPFFIVCPDGGTIFEMPTHPPNGWPTINGEVRPRLDRVNAMRVRRACLECSCNQLTGEFQSSSQSGGHCGPDENFYRKCEFWFGCFCGATMRNPPHDPAVELLDYQDAINNIPGRVRQLNDGWHWQPYPDVMMTWPDRWIHGGIQILEEWEMAALVVESDRDTESPDKLYTADDPKGKGFKDIRPWPPGGYDWRFDRDGSGGGGMGGAGAGAGLVSKREETFQHEEYDKHH
ncbi:hypothetical protein TWF506_007151 [Arthrobotrys conoides]|uniref:Uncharacterized protein n=1 Tax=Arthrobotrys conoides TaxID=74498 RepID=A0AAN8NNP6_9PEZI